MATRRWPSGESSVTAGCAVGEGDGAGDGSAVGVGDGDAVARTNRVEDWLQPGGADHAAEDNVGIGRGEFVDAFE